MSFGFPHVRVGESVRFHSLSVFPLFNGQQTPVEYLLSAEGIGDAALSPDGKTFAITRGGQIVLMPSDGGWPVTLTSSTGAKAGLNWSPDSRYIAYASQGSIWSVPVEGGQPKRLTHASPASGGDPREGQAGRGQGTRGRRGARSERAEVQQAAEPVSDYPGNPAEHFEDSQ